MNPNLAIVRCINPQCLQQLRVPVDKGQIRPTCPTCRTTWLWEPNVAAPDVTSAILEVFCSVSGEKHHSRFTRPAYGRIFKFDRTTPVTPSNLILPHTTSAGALGESLTLEDDWSSSFKSIVDLRSKAETGRPAVEFNIADFDFSNWHCAGCSSPTDDRASNQFARCTKCNQLVCLSKTMSEPDGSQWFQCYEACGCRAKIGGTMQSVTGKAHATNPNASQGTDAISSSHDATLLDNETRFKLHPPA